MVLYQFYWEHGGNDVKVTGDFDHWAGTTAMQRTEDGAWPGWAKVVDLPANTKVYYKFIVDGEWRVDEKGEREGDGAHENNFITTGTTYSKMPPPNAAAANDLPVLGVGATYVSGSTPLSEEPSREESNPLQPQENVAPTTSIVDNNPALSGLGGHINVPHHETALTRRPEGLIYDDSGPSPSNPIAMLQKQNSTVKDVYDEAVSSIPSTDEIKHDVEHVVEVAGGLLATDLAAGAAMFGLSTKSAESESSPITGHAATSASEKSTELAPKSEAALSESHKVSQTDALEKTAVAAATSAATNAYNASGLSGLSGVGAPLSSLSQDGTAGYTSIGTAVNEKTGVVGTSKIVQGISDASPTENTQTAKVAGTTALGLLDDHENGAKVERINDHAVLAEVGIGGAAIGTAVVTDEKISSPDQLDIPPQAAEHLSNATQQTTESLVSRPAAVSADFGLAPALTRGKLKSEPAVLTTQEDSAVSVAAPPHTQPAPSDDATVQIVQEVSTKVVPITEQAAVVVAESTTAQVVTQPATEVVASSPVQDMSTTTADLTSNSKAAAPRGPSKSAPQAAARKASSGGMRQTLRTEPSSTATTLAATTDTTDTTDPSKKKKGGLLRKVKSMFSKEKEKK